MQQLRAVKVSDRKDKVTGSRKAFIRGEETQVSIHNKHKEERPTAKQRGDLGIWKFSLSSRTRAFQGLEGPSFFCQFE